MPTKPAVGPYEVRIAKCLGDCYSLDGDASPLGKRPQVIARRQAVTRKPHPSITSVSTIHPF
jgi:hypothetical protein